MESRMQIRLPKDLHERFKEIAADNSQIPSMLIRKWIEQYVSENEKTGKEG